MKRTIMMALLASTAAVAAPATAQTEAPPAEQAAQEEQVPVGDIVVTARRVSESLQTTPVAVTAVTGDALRSEEHTSELQSLMRISYAVFCLKKKKHYTELKY